MRLQLIQIRNSPTAPLIGSRLINYNGTKGNGDRMQLRLTYYRKQILYQYKVYYNISDPEEDQGCTSSEIQKGHPVWDGPFLYNRHSNTLWMNICYKLSQF